MTFRNVFKENKRYFYFSTNEPRFYVKCVHSDGRVIDIMDSHGKPISNIPTDLYNTLQLMAREVATRIKENHGTL